MIQVTKAQLLLVLFSVALSCVMIGFLGSEVKAQRQPGRVHLVKFEDGNGEVRLIIGGEWLNDGTDFRGADTFRLVPIVDAGTHD